MIRVRAEGETLGAFIMRADDRRTLPEIVAVVQELPYATLYALPTLSEGQSDDLKIDAPAAGERPAFRVWLARTTVDDGEPYNHRVSIEVLKRDRWVTLIDYEHTA